MFYDIMDICCADALQVDIETFIEKIEKTTYNRTDLIISAIMSEDENKIAKAIRIFNLIQ